MSEDWQEETTSKSISFCDDDLDLDDDYYSILNVPRDVIIY
jgi:hypothetical protein